ncbi:MAG TPA: ribonuclease E/G [Acidocella sp.]|nr:ribonuclease E/G [Acidocella sp.]HQU05606.1 ribonuclease E/G [Acidocella sp.]
MRRIAVSVQADAARIALLDGDVLREYALWNPEQPDGVGDIYTGRVSAKLSAMAGSFVELGEMAGFLPDSAGAAKLSEGDYICVQVTRAPQGGKGPRLAVTTEAPGDKPGLLRRGPGPLLELAARFPNLPIFIDDYALMATLRPTLEGRMTHQAKCFDAVLEDEIAGLAEMTAELGRGTKMHIAATAALTAIDIDAGSASAASGAKPQAQLALNERLVPEIVRQIVLRNLSGGILIDFAGMKPKARLKLTDPLTTALKTDPLKGRFLGFSNLGFAEILRPRIRPPLHEMLNQ